MRGYVTEVAAGHEHGERVAAQPRPAAARTRVEAPVARDQHARLHLVALLLEVLEEAAHAVPVAAAGFVALDDEDALFVVEFAPRALDGNPQPPARGEQVLLERAAHRRREGRDRAAFERERGVGNHAREVDRRTRPKPWQVSQAPSGVLNEKRAGSGAGKRRPQPSHAKPSRKRARSPFSTTTITSPSLRANAAATASTSRAAFGVAAQRQAVDEHEPFVAAPGEVARREFVEFDDAGPRRRAGACSRRRAAARAARRRHCASPRAAASRSRRACPRSARGCAGPPPRRRRALRAGRNRGNASRRSSQEQAQQVEYFGRGAHRRTRVGDAVALLDRDRRRQMPDRVDVRARQPLEELARIGRERRDVAPLSLGVERVERERRLAGPGHARDRRQSAQRHAARNTAQVVGARVLDLGSPRRVAREGRRKAKRRFRPAGRARRRSGPR